MTADGAAAVEILQAELSRAKEQARISNAAADLKAEQDAQRQCQERISTMERELKDAPSRCKSLEEDNKANAAKLDKALLEAREARSESRAAREEIRQAGEIAAGKPFLLQTKLVIRIMPRLIKCGVLQTHCWTCRRVSPMRRSFSKRKKDGKHKSCSGRNLACQSVRCC